MEAPDFDDENHMDTMGGSMMHEDLIDDTDMFNSNEMEIELDEEHKSEDGERCFQPVTVNRAIVDLDFVIQNFKSHALIIRLNYIAETCPPLRADAIRALVDYLRRSTQNTAMYSLIYQKIELYKSSGAIKDDEIFSPLDQEWLDHASQNANNRLDALNTEFRRQKDDGVKESIRRAMNDVFNQLLSMGNIDEALKLYSRGIREYCTNPSVLIEMLLNWITVTVYAEQWSKLSILLPQIERAVSEVMDREIPANLGQSYQRAVSSTLNTSNFRNAKEFVATSNAKISAISGLECMKKGDFKQAARRFISIELESFTYPEALSQNDIAVYGAVCALATYDRTELKEKVLGSSQFRKFLESEPKLIELLHKFCRNEFGTSLDILSDLKDQLLLNVYLTPHVKDLYTLIRRRAIVQFFQPYSSANMQIMAAEFRTTADQLEEELVELIRCGLLNARIDTHEQIVEAKITDRRLDVYKRSLKANKLIDNLARSLLIRASLQEWKCIVGLESNSRKTSTCKSIF